MDNPFATTYNQFHNQFTQCVRDLTGLAKEHHESADLESRISGILRTFVNNMQATQSALFFDMVNYTPPLPYESAVPARQLLNLPAIQPMESPFREPGERLEPQSHKPQQQTHTHTQINKTINIKTIKLPSIAAKNTLDKYLNIDPTTPATPVTPVVTIDEPVESPEPDHGRYDHIVQDYSQCCARVGAVEYYVEMEPPEFLDNYPHGTYQSMDGYVIGDPCMRMVHNDLFDAGHVFCKRHNSGYEDIRNPPSSHANGPADANLDIVFENDYPRPFINMNDMDFPLSNFDIDLI